MAAVRPDRTVGGPVARIVAFVLLAVVAIACLIPILWLLLAPGKTDAEIVGGSPLGWGTIGGYRRAWDNVAQFENGIIYHWITNSITYTVLTVLLAVLAATLGGYGLAFMRSRARRPLLYATLISMIVPTAALVLPLFLEMAGFGLLNTGASVILPGAFYPFGVYLAFIHFSTALPREVVEAARIDGASELQVFWTIALPLSKSMIGLLAFFSFVTSWTNFFLPFVMLTGDDRFTLPLGLNALMANTPALNPAAGGSFLPIHRPEVALAGLLAVLPVALVFLVSQRFLARGILTGAVKS